MELDNKVYNYISIAKGLLSKDKFKFYKIQGETKSGTEKIFLMKKKRRKIQLTITSETRFAIVEDPLKICRTASNETTLVSEIPITIKEEHVIIAPGQGKTPVLVLRDEFDIMCIEIFQ